MSHSALASLTAQYTDSENEDAGSPDTENSYASQVIIPEQKSQSHTSPPSKRHSNEEVGKKKRPKKIKRLVSYLDDTQISDESEESSEESEESSEEENDKNNFSGDGSNSHESKEYISNNEAQESRTYLPSPNQKPTLELEKAEKYAHYKFSLPPEPKGKPSAELVDKVCLLYDKMGTTSMDMNHIIQGRKEFRNPSIYEKLIQFCDINEFGTNYPPEIYDPLQWGPESFYEELSLVQKNEMLRRQKERKDNDRIEQATALARKVEEQAKRRKSKWDQPAPVKTTLPTTLTTTVTGTKGTVISAFGSLPKRVP